MNADKSAGMASASPFQRKPPPLALRLGFGAFMQGVFGPSIRVLDRFGRAEKMFRRMQERQTKRYAKTNPLRCYVPGPQDVFIATFPKSGTNWMMQIAHQLIYHGEAEFEHIHNVVPWPDSKLIPPMRHYAIPLEDALDWQTAPERKRVIKTHFSWELLPYSEEARYILVIRDPKDAFVSAY